MAADEIFAIAPTDVPSEHNTLRSPLRPIAGWELADAHFAFDSSILLPSMTAELADLIGLVRANPGAPLSIFGHTDTAGEDEYNKILAGRRAMAMFALLTRRTDLWEQLFSHPHGGDDWGRDHQAVGLMQAHLELTGPVSPAARPGLFEKYMSALSRDPAGKAFGLPKSAFLGKGADSRGKADFQGCGEFNPVKMFSAAEQRSFTGPGRKAARDEAAAENRRVTVFLFPEDTVISVPAWPCPRALEETGGCRKRFWSDAEARRKNQEASRHFPEDPTTFACRFYQRLAEPLSPRRTSRLILRLVSSEGLPLKRAEYRLAIGGRNLVAKTDDNGVINQPFSSQATSGVLKVADWTVELTIADLPAANVPPGARTRLTNLGFPKADLDVALFQEEHGLASHGKLDGPTVAKLLEQHGS